MRFGRFIARAGAFAEAET